MKGLQDINECGQVWPLLSLRGRISLYRWVDVSHGKQTKQNKRKLEATDSVLRGDYS